LYIIGPLKYISPAYLISLIERRCVEGFM